MRPKADIWDSIVWKAQTGHSEVIGILEQMRQVLLPAADRTQKRKLN